MAGPKADKTDKRHLIRWTVEHDQRLLLCIQYVCSDKGIKLPWDAIAKQLDEKVTEGAVSQHLSKVRARLVELGHEVPPSLRRGGPPGSSRSSATNPTTPTSSTGQAKKASARSTSKAGVNDEDEEIEGVEDERAASDDDYSPVPAKRAKRASGRRKPKRQAGDQSEEDIEISGPVNTKSQKPGSSQKKSRASKDTKEKNPVKKETGNRYAENEFEEAGDAESNSMEGLDRPNKEVSAKATGRKEKIVILRLPPGYTSFGSPQGLTQGQDNSSASSESEDGDLDMKENEADEPQGVPETGAIMHTGNIAQDTTMGEIAPIGHDPAEMADFAGHGLTMQYLRNPVSYPNFYGNMGDNATLPTQERTVPVGIGSGQQVFAGHSGAMQNLLDLNLNPNLLMSLDQHDSQHGLTSQAGFPFPRAGVNATLQGQVMPGMGGSQGGSNAINMGPLSFDPMMGFSTHGDPQAFFQLSATQEQTSPLSPVALPFDLRPVEEVMAADVPPQMQDPAHMTNEELDVILDQEMANGSDGLGDKDAVMGSGNKSEN